MRRLLLALIDGDERVLRVERGLFVAALLAIDILIGLQITRFAGVTP